MAAAVVELAVPELAQGAAYYEALLGVTPEDKAGSGTISLVGDHLRVNLGQGSAKAAADVTLSLTSGMFARILDASMKGQCTIVVDSPEQVRLTDRYGQRWTLRC